jgi:hypothetical protein
MNMMGENKRTSRLGRERLLGLASVLEVSISDSPLKYDQVVNTASMIRNMVKKDNSLSSADKVRLVRGLAMAKARVYSGGTPNALNVYRKLESISDELIRLL